MIKNVKRAAPVGAQWIGGGMVFAGVLLLFGVGWTLLVAGVLVAALGTLKEAKVI